MIRIRLFVFADINECEGDATKLCGNGECINIVGSYFCQCEDGYSVKPEIGPLCTDEDECELGTHNCDKNALCINNPVCLIFIYLYIIYVAISHTYWYYYLQYAKKKNMVRLFATSRLKHVEIS